jgi:glutaconate CoA-transferase, subunit A
VLLAEEIVPSGSLDPDRVTIASPFVGAVAEAPRGAHPTAVAGRYDYDRAHIEEYSVAAREGGAAYERYLDEYVYGVDSHASYLERAGILV